MSVEITLELGHRASLRSTPTPEGFTHDWVVFVRGVGTDANNIHYFVEKVVFILHESFPKHKRVVKEPPYQVAESGYAGFIMPIEIHFRSKEEPKKVCFEYDLFLRLEEPVFHIRYEKLTFQYPTEDFRKKLLKGGGGCPTIPPTIPSGVPLQTQGSASLQHSEEHRSVPSTKAPGVTAEKKPRSHSTPKESNKPVPLVRSGQPFTDIFGSPIKAKHSSGNPSVKTKEGGNSNHQKSARVPSVLGAPCKELKPSVKDGHCITESKNSKITKPVKQEKEPKIPAKRAFAIDGKISSAPDKKKRRASTSLDNDDKIDVIIKPKDSKEKKEKHKNKVSAAANFNRKETEKLKTKTLESKESIKFPKTNSLVHKIDNKHPSPQNGESNPQELEGLGGKEMKNKLNDSNSPVSEITKNNRPLSTMIAEMDNVLISPLSSDAEDTRHARENEPESDLDDTHISMVKPVTKSCVKQDKKLSKSRSGSKPKLATSQGSNMTKDNQEAKNSVVDEKIVKSKKSLDPSNLVELVELQQKIMSLNDRILLQRVVDVIEKTGRFQMTSTSFDFDLCSLDHSTLRKLNCLLVK